MRLYSGQLRLIAADIIKAVVDHKLVEIEPDLRGEAELDIEGVFREYQRMDRELTQRARDLTAGEGRSAEMKTKRRLAKEKNFVFGEDALDYVLGQILETFMISPHIEEIYAADHEIRARIVPIIRRHTASRDAELDEEVRAKIKNLQEGSTAFDIEYERVMNRVRRAKGIEED